MTEAIDKSISCICMLWRPLTCCRRFVTYSSKRIIWWLVLILPSSFPFWARCYFETQLFHLWLHKFYPVVCTIDKLTRQCPFVYAVFTLPLTLCIGSTTTATARSDRASKLCCVLMSTPDNQQPKPGCEWYQPTTISGLQRMRRCVTQNTLQCSTAA